MTAAPHLVVLAAGGTGGHVFPAQALAAELATRGHRMALVTDSRGDAVAGAPETVEVHRIRAGGVAGKSIVARLRSAPELAFGTLQAHRLLKRLAPAAVVGFGGYASAPTMLAASFNGLATMIHEQNAVLGRANRFLASRVDRIATAFESAAGLPADAAGRVTHTGMPVRPAITAMRDVPYPAFDDGGVIRLLIIGGSQGAHVFSDVIPEALARLPEVWRRRLRVVQQCRPEDLDATRQAYSGGDIKAELATFFEDVPERLAAAHLLIARAGASTVSELTAIGRPAILVPYRFAIDDHQSANAHAVDEAGAGWLMPESAFTAQSLAERLTELFAMPATLTRAAAGSRAAGRPDAARRLADLVCTMLPNGQSTDGRAAA